MAREHARILCRIWRDKDFIQQSTGAQRMYFLLLSQQLLNWAGVVPLTVQKWANLAQDCTVDDLRSDLAELEEHEYVVIDTRTQELLVRSFIRNDGVWKQPNVLTAALRQAREVESPRLRLVLAQELRKLGKEQANEVADEIEPDLSEHLAEPLAEPLSGGSEQHEESNAKPLAKGSRRVGGRAAEGQAKDLGDGEGGRGGGNAREDVDQLCERLLARVHGNGATKPKITEGWRTQARLLLDTDHRPLEQALRLIDWATKDPFWSANILSMPKFREQYDQLLIKARQEHQARQGAGYQSATDANIKRFLGEQSNPEQRQLPGGDVHD